MAIPRVKFLFALLFALTLSPSYQLATSKSNNSNGLEDILSDTFSLLDALDQKLTSISNKTPSAMMKDNLRALDLSEDTAHQQQVSSNPIKLDGTNDDATLLKSVEEFASGRRRLSSGDDTLVGSSSNEQPVSTDQSESASLVSRSPLDTGDQPHAKKARQFVTDEAHLQSGDFTEGHIKFTLDLMQAIFTSQSYTFKTNSIESFLISPLSVQMVLMMMHLGARGQTRREIGNCLHLFPQSDKNGPASGYELGPTEVNSSGGGKLKRRHQASGEKAPKAGQPQRQSSLNQPMGPSTNAHELFGGALRNLLKDPVVMKALTNANQIFLQKNLPLAAQYDWAVRHYYGTDIKLVDFQHQTEPSTNSSDSNKAKQDDSNIQQLVNEWIERQTRGKISNFLTSPVASSTLLMAINVLFFKGDWQYKFDPADTEADSWFTQANGKTVKIPMMVNRLPLAFAHDQAMKTSVIELPYKAQRLGLFLLLPDEVSGIFHTMQMLNSSSFANLISSMRKPAATSDQSGSGINVRIPKFSIESSPRMSQILGEQLGLKSLFMPESADLSGILAAPLSQKRAGNSSSADNTQASQSVQLGLDELLHKAVLQVDEQGSVAAASSAAIVERVGLFNSNYFEADHPFLLFLMDKQTGLVLFSGVFAGDNKPTYSVTTPSTSALSTNTSNVTNPANNMTTPTTFGNQNSQQRRQ